MAVRMDTARRRRSWCTSPRRRQEVIAGYLGVLPWVLGFGLFTIGPMLFSIGIIFTDWAIVREPSFIGFGNFVTAGKDPLFWKSLYNTAWITVFTVPVSLVVSMFLAILVNNKLKGINLFRTVFYLPSQTPAVAGAILWLWLLQPQYGLINGLLDQLHLPRQSFLVDTNWSKMIFVVIGIWGTGAGMLIYLAGLSGIPRTMYEAASIDGANWIARLRHVTLPMLTPVIFFNLILGIIGSMQGGFTQALLITEGGPLNSTLVFILYLWRNGFEYFDMGYAALLAWILFAIILLITLANFKLSGRWVHYEGELTK